MRSLALAAPRTHTQHSHRTEHEANFRRVTGIYNDKVTKLDKIYLFFFLTRMFQIKNVLCRV